MAPSSPYLSNPRLHLGSWQVRLTVPRKIPASAPSSGAYRQLTHAMAIVLLGESLAALQGGQKQKHL